uniref:HD-GYP domain-containing protein n=1 Tax=Chrysiogenes arsenatis TaxID=309797 RepID=UPI000482DF52
QLKQNIYRNNQILLRSGVVLTRAYIEKLRELGYVSVRVDEPESSDIIPNDTISPELHQRGVETVTRIFQAVKDSNQSRSLITNPKFYQDILGYIDLLLKELSRTATGLVCLGSLKAHSSYTFQHSIDVAVVALVFGRRFGLWGDHLESLGLGAILHDMGKMFIPDSILEKPAKLTAEEFEVIKTHPQHGHDVIVVNEKFKHRTRITNIVLHHHERHSGGGYPAGLQGEDREWDPTNSRQLVRGIHPLTQMVTLCDVFDALTSYRPYRSAMTIPEALALMANEMASTFHPVYLEKFIQSINHYPVGSNIRISQGKYKGYMGTVSGSEREERKDGRVHYAGTVRLFYNGEMERIDPIEVSIGEAEGY